MIEKVDQESEEYRKWKEGSVPIEQPQEEPIKEEVPKPEVNQSFFDRTFKVKNDTDRMKKTYYFIFFFTLFCVDHYIKLLIICAFFTHNPRFLRFR